jgi:hypothetical protein
MPGRIFFQRRIGTAMSHPARMKMAAEPAMKRIVLKKKLPLQMASSADKKTNRTRSVPAVRIDPYTTRSL